MITYDEVIYGGFQGEGQLALTPVLCTDCKQYVPLGWVVHSTVVCTKNTGANGVQYGHRTERDTIVSVIDQFNNKMEGQPS